MPGIFPVEQGEDNSQNECNQPGHEQLNTRNIMPGLVELPEVPSVTHQDQREDANWKCFYDFLFLWSADPQVNRMIAGRVIGG